MDDTILGILKLKKQGFCCSQIMLILALEAQGKVNHDLVRSIGGLCYGGYMGEICGALSGGVCLISLYAGKGGEKEDPDERHLLMVNELTEWFNGVAHDEYGGIRCDDILEKYPDRSICGMIVADVYKKCMTILTKHGFIPSGDEKTWKSS